MIDRMGEVLESRCRRLSSSNACSRLSGVRSSWAALATKLFCASKALSRRSRSPSTVSARFRSSSRGPRRASRSWTLRAEIRLMAVFVVRSGRNILPATSQPSTNEMTDVKLARGRPGDGVQVRRSRPSPVACGERAPPRRPRPRRSPLRQRPLGRTTRPIRRRGSGVTRNLQVLTISRFKATSCRARVDYCEFWCPAG